MKKSDFIFGITMFLVSFIVTFFVIKQGGGFVKTNMVYFPRPLTWGEMFKEIPSVAVCSLLFTIILFYVLKKMKIL